MLALTWTLAVVGSAVQDPPTIRVGESTVPMSSLDQVLGEKERAQASEWIEWGKHHKYKAVLDESRRVLLLGPIKRKAGGKPTASPSKPRKESRAEQSAVSRKLELIDATLGRADTLFPMPSEEAPTEGEHETWLAETERDSLPVLIELRDEEDLRSLLARIVESHPYLEPWAGAAAGYSGFTLSRPLIGVWLAQGDGLEEWNPHNELVNRLTRLLLVERYGNVPRWLDLGLAWQAEMSILKRIYCYPERSGFVSVLEHEDWGRALRGLYRERQGAFSLSEIACTRGKELDPDAAYRSWGVAEFLVMRHPDSIRPILSDLARDRLVHGRIDEADGTWKLVVGYEAPVSTQEALLRKHVGEDALEELAEFAKKGAK